MLLFVVFVVVIIWLVLTSTVAYKRILLGPLSMLLKHQHPLVIRVGGRSRQQESNALAFGLGLFHLLL